MNVIFRRVALGVWLAGALHGEGGLTPALPVHVWGERQHLIGLLSVSSAGDARFSRLVCEDSNAPARLGHWIEAWKVEQLRQLMPSALRPFRLGESVVVDGIKFVRVLVAKETTTMNGPDGRTRGLLTPGSHDNQARFPTFPTLHDICVARRFIVTCIVTLGIPRNNNATSCCRCGICIAGVPTGIRTEKMPRS